MSLNVKIELIEETESKIADMTAEERRMREVYMRDGVIDETEQDALDRIRSKIDRLSTAVADLRAEIEENKRIWESRNSDWTDVQGKLQALQDFGHGEAAPSATAIGDVSQAVGDQRWADATAGLDQVVMNIEPAWKDYELQVAAQTEYDPMRADLETRLASAEAAEPQTETIAGILGQIRTNLPAMDSSVTARDYVGALELLRTAVSEQDAAEAEIMRVQELKAQYDEALTSFQPRLLDASVSEYQTLAELQAPLISLQDAMETAAAGYDYETAKTKLDELSSAVDEFLAARGEIETQRADYEAKLTGLRGRLTAASVSEMATTSELQQNIVTADDAMKAAAEAEDYVEALRLSGNVETALAAYEEVIEDRDLYEARLDAMREELIEASVSQEKWAYLLPIQNEMATIQTDMETAAAAEDYATASDKIGDLEAKLAEFYAAIDAKRLEYDTARAELDGRFQHLDTCSYPLSAEKAAVQNAIAAIDVLVAEEDWAGALDGLLTAETELVAFDTVHKSHDDTIRTDVATKLAGIKAIIAANALSTSSTKKSLIKLVAEIDAALAKTDDLDKLPERVKLADELSKDLEVINQINARIDDKWDINKDNEAVAIVEELKKDPAKLANLPFEARNRLIDEMLDGSVGEDEQKAIQELWASTKDTIDPAFEAQDAKLTGQMLKALEDDPKVQEYAKNWAGMSNADKQKAMKHIGGIIGGDDGYQLEGVEDIDFTADGKRGSTDCSTSSGLRGFHAPASGSKPEEISVCMSNTYTLSNGSKWNPSTDMGDVLMNLTHEVGHGYQEQLIDKLESGELVPGDPEYEQARALQLDRKYFEEFPDDYKGSTYINSPFEQLSRITANRVGSDIPAGYGTGYVQEL